MSEKKPSLVHTLVDKLYRFIEILIAIFLGTMIFFTFFNVVMRQFGKGYPWSEEVSRICFIYLTYLGSIIAARENKHLMVDTLICHLKPAGQKVLYMIIQIMIIAIMAFLGVGAWNNAWINRNDFWVATGVPVFLVHFAGVMLCFAVIVTSLVNIYRLLVDHEDPVMLLTGGLGADDELDMTT